MGFFLRKGGSPGLVQPDHRSKNRTLKISRAEPRVFSLARTARLPRLRDTTLRFPATETNINPHTPPTATADAPFGASVPYAVESVPGSLLRGLLETVGETMSLCTILNVHSFRKGKAIACRPSNVPSFARRSLRGAQPNPTVSLIVSTVFARRQVLGRPAILRALYAER
jgi:hypothetical protein